MSDESFEHFKSEFSDFNEDKGLVEQVDDDGEVWKLTEAGIRFILEIYERGLAGEPLESIEEAMNMDPSDDHAEYKILMAMGDLSGIFDKYDELEEMSRMLDEVETEYLYGENED
jgi:hypothetical protein